MNLSRQEYVKLRAEYADLAAKHKELRRQGRYTNGDERLEALRKEWSAKRGYPYVPRRNALGTRVAPQPPSEEDKAEDAKSARGTRGVGRAKAPAEK